MPVCRKIWCCESLPASRPSFGRAGFLVSRAFSSSRCKRDDLLRLLCRFNLPITRSFFWFHQFTVVGKRHAAVVMSKLQGRRGCILEGRQVIGREAVSQSVVR